MPKRCVIDEFQLFGGLEIYYYHKNFKKLKQKEKFKTKLLN